MIEEIAFPSSQSETVAEPRFAGPSCEGSGFHPMKYK